MGVKNLTKQLKAFNKVGDSLLKENITDDKNAPAIVPNPDVTKKRIGVDASVILHKALHNIESAREFQCIPKIPITKIDTACIKLINIARRANIELVICTDGAHHMFKGSVDAHRKKDRNNSQLLLNEIFQRQDLDNDAIEEADKLMKKAAHVTEEILSQAIDIFRQNNIEVYGAPYEADFQLVEWENSGFTHGTISIDSDIFLLGSKMLIDSLNVEKLGNCFIYKRDDIMSTDTFAPGSSLWTNDDFLVYCGLQGCDWIKRLHGLKQKRIEEFMRYWVVCVDNSSRVKLLDELALEIKTQINARTFTSNAKASKESDIEHCDKFSIRFLTYLQLARHAPVIKVVDGKHIVAPLNNIDGSSSWKELLHGFDPMVGFYDCNDVKDFYVMRRWARTKQPLRRLRRPVDPIDDGNTLPHKSIINFCKVPPEILPTNALIEWLSYHGIPVPKAEKRQEVLRKVKLAIACEHPLDRAKIRTDENITTNSYVSWEHIAGVSKVLWSANADQILSFIREGIRPVDDEYLDTIFGTGKNGIRLRALKRFNSGSLDINSLRIGKAVVEGEGGCPVTIIEIKCTPSMKSEVYGSCLVFQNDGTYLNNKSKCDCPNGWLFCSHSLAVFLLFRVMQLKDSWGIKDLLDVMPQPIKTLQNLPIAAKMVLTGSTPEETKAIGRQIAKEVPGYSAKDDNTRIETDAVEETEAIYADLSIQNKAKSIKLCDKVDAFIGSSKQAQRVDANSATEGNGEEINKLKSKKRKGQKKARKVTTDDVKQYNESLLDTKQDATRRCATLLRHNRLHRLMKEGLISSDNSLSYHLNHFSDDRNKELEEKRSEANTDDLPPDEPDMAFLADYFAAI
ncbi:hypothetical protein ACHAWX_001262 [Stephanocyclus meneghinianus]